MRRLRMKLVGALAAIGFTLSFWVVASTAPAAATSCPANYYCHENFYSSSTYTTVVGHRGYHCLVFHQSGVTSAYSKYSSGPQDC